MGEFFAWVITHHAYLDLLFCGFIMTLLIIANIVEQKDELPLHKDERKDAEQNTRR